jgi:hypothetical protein
VVCGRRNTVGDIMKKGTSFYLEEDILDEIESYRIDNGLKSKNTALERIILEYKTIKKELEYTRVLAEYAKNMMSNGSFKANDIQEHKSEIKKEIVPENKNTKLRSAIRNAYDEME